jgi:uncharacterized membrane protein YgcG
MKTASAFRRPRPLAVFFVLTVALICANTPAHADVNDFSFTSFDGDYYLSRNPNHTSHLHVVERLVAEFPNFDQNHGLLRAIPERYDGHDVNLRVGSVTNATGGSLPYSSGISNANLVLKIGDANTYVHGTQTYVITYDMDNVTSQPTSYQGFFWDINGDQWSQTFGRVTAQIHVPPGLAATYQPQHNQCFTGTRGSTAGACTISDTSSLKSTTTGDLVITATTTRPLTANETLTAQIGFAPNTFAGYIMPLNQALRWLLIGLFTFLLPIGLTLWITLRRWWRYGRDPRGRGIIIPEYIPPPDLSVAGASALLHQGFRPKAISAIILDLAVHGYVKIYEVKNSGFLTTKSTYELELTKDPADLRPNDSGVTDMLFGAKAPVGTRINLNDLANKLYQPAATFGKAVDQNLAGTDYFRATPSKAMMPFTGAGAIALILALIFHSVYVVGLAVCGVILLLVARVMPARTAKGVEARDHLLGLKQFISVAEAERIKVLQSPHGPLTEKIDVGDHTQLVKLYEKLLPYAMLFGLEKDWAKQFASLYDQQPGWYAGSGSFNAGYFAGSLSSFGSTATTSFTAPSSSSGGGFSGGGGGGGGGGGW